MFSWFTKSSTSIPTSITDSFIHIESNPINENIEQIENAKVKQILNEENIETNIEQEYTETKEIKQTNTETKEIETINIPEAPPFIFGDYIETCQYNKYNQLYYMLPENLHSHISIKRAELENRKQIKIEFMNKLIPEIYFEYRARIVYRQRRFYFMIKLQSEIFNEYENRFLHTIHKLNNKKIMNVVLEKIPYAHIEYLKHKEAKYYHVLNLYYVHDQLISKININLHNIEELLKQIEIKDDKYESEEEYIYPKISRNKYNKRKKTRKEKMKSYKKEKRQENLPEINIELSFDSPQLNTNTSTNNNFVEKDMNKVGYLDVVMGPMFSGKSTSRLLKLSGMADQRFHCLYVNSVKDVRTTEGNDGYVTTHNSSYSKLSPKIHCVKTENLANVDVTGYDYIAVDELQFFDYDNTVAVILEWVRMGKYVLVASLDADCYRRKFGRVLDLIPFADRVKKVTAYCDICRDNYGVLVAAPFTARMTTDKTAELVGGHNMYKAMCRKCHDFHLGITTQ